MNNKDMTISSNDTDNNFDMTQKIFEISKSRKERYHQIN